MLTHLLVFILIAILIGSIVLSLVSHLFKHVIYGRIASVVMPILVFGFHYSVPGYTRVLMYLSLAAFVFNLAIWLLRHLSRLL